MLESPPPKWTDGHCHLSDLRLTQEQRHNWIQNSRAAGFSAFINGGVDVADWKKQLELKEAGAPIICSFGMHPEWVARATAEDCDAAFAELQKLLPRASALGELGLDARAPSKPTLEFQLHYFRKQLELLHVHRKPLVLHIVTAHSQALPLLQEYSSVLRSGIVHNYSADYSIGKHYLDLGFKLSISSNFTDENRYLRLKESFHKFPNDAWVLETDAPDQRPHCVEVGEHTSVSLLQLARHLEKNFGPLSAEEWLGQSSGRLRDIFIPSEP